METIGVCDLLILLMSQHGHHMSNVGELFLAGATQAVRVLQVVQNQKQHVVIVSDLLRKKICRVTDILIKFLAPHACLPFAETVFD
jgi:hypothetical protein